MPYYVIAPVLVEEYLPCALFRYFRKKNWRDISFYSFLGRSVSTKR